MPLASHRIYMFLSLASCVVGASSFGSAAALLFVVRCHLLQPIRILRLASSESCFRVGDGVVCRSRISLGGRQRPPQPQVWSSSSAVPPATLAGCAASPATPAPAASPRQPFEPALVAAPAPWGPHPPSPKMPPAGAGPPAARPATRPAAACFASGLDLVAGGGHGA